MASAVHVGMIDDDDDFDWDAAVREIDAVCDEATKRSSSAATAATTATATVFRNSSLHTDSCPKIENNKPTSSRQSTLDRFIGLTGLKSSNQDARHDAHDTVECNDERVSSVSIDPEAAKTWIYPENVPVRDYQVSITRTALFSNTLVSLPTGLGKTLIAAVVMYNYFRWFPEGKIVFAAPSRPLVLQQIEACHNIVGISQEYTVDMTGQTKPEKRVPLWKTKRIFFLTPQVLEKDIQSGSCLMKQIVCLVFDEAHHASGDYSYCVAFRELMAAPVQFRLLALTATPGCKHETVQQVIDNLQISSLEHRSESDADVVPYVHDRKIDLIQVAMGKEAVDVRDLLMIVISRYVKKLSTFGISLRRDIQSLSPRDFLESRTIFREAPPQNLPEMKYREIEGFYGVLITLYHIRKQLLEHGIGPAYKMLDEKLTQGILACHLSRDETIWKAKVIMKQFVDHGVLSPKFSKMLEVLVEHFKKQDPKQSRVIIFSNFRESVREIMSSLATIGEYVKATEFIGQNSGKSKGQSQKVQQAILKKFRAGEFNVIVATSIGEEGLDIMEVDLVICFDANVSPLRMVQRMGRTGRKNKGRVVVLACEGSEINGYKSKQSKSKAIKKHMLNGGTNSFRFHPSPRMVPHIFRPEKVLVKFLIEEYVHRGKKVKEDDAIQTPKYKQKLNNNETDLLEKYFYPSSENDWRPSLIAFPHFQAYPSRIHQVSHSLRTGMLIDTMQELQGLSFNHQDEETSDGCFRVETLDHHDSNTREEDDSIQKEPEFKTKEKHDCPPIHSFLFGSDFTSVNSLGRVLILSVPIFPLKPKTSSPQTRDFSPVKDLHEGYNGVFTTTPVKSQGADESTDSKAAADLSPRLTNLLMSGVVPESPIDNGSSKPKDYNMTPDHDMLPVADNSISLVENKNEIDLLNNSLEKNCVSASKIVGETRTPLTNSCSEDWILKSGEKSISQPKPRLKRLRRYGDFQESENLSDNQEIVGRRSCAPLDHGRGEKKLLNDARVFIEDEAEVSSEGSGDEDVDHGQDSYGGSFIDDRINPTVANTQAETAECDMMAIYRRSLLSQSPLIRTPQFPVVPNQTHGGGSSSISLNTSRLFTSDAGTSTTATGIPSTSTAGISTVATGIRKRKLSYSQDGSLPIRNLETEVFSDHPVKEPPWKTEEAAAMDDFDSDEFYQGIDLDALQKQAEQQLRLKSQVSGKMNEKLNNRDLDFLGSPSFDLGI